MLRKFIEDIMFGLDWITTIALVLIIVFFIIFMIFYKKTRHISGTILTTMGITATFLGIAIGLWKFDTNDIQNSIPELLSGLKTAFWASFIGVTGALVLKLRDAYNSWRSKDNEEVEILLIHELKTLNKNLIIHNGSIRKEMTDFKNETIAELQKVTAGLKEITQEHNQDNASLVDILKLLRIENNEKLDIVSNQLLQTKQEIIQSKEDNNHLLEDLKQAQIQALEKLSEMSSKTLIEALEGVIRDFNNKITEQFGENFKKLNEAVGALLIWQQQYKEHIETVVDRHNEITHSMQIVIETMDNLEENQRQFIENSESFNKVTGNLSIMLQDLENKQGNMVELLEQLGQLIESASHGLPNIEKQILAITEGLNQSVEKITHDTNQAIQNNYKLLSDSLEKSNKQMTDKMRETIQNFDVVNNEMKQQAEQAINQIDAINNGLEEALSKSLTQLVGQLTALSEKFVQDYTPLTQELQRLVQISRSLQVGQ